MKVSSEGGVVVRVRIEREAVSRRLDMSCRLGLVGR